MSLRLWLPLNGTLENKGLDNITINQVGSNLTYSNGKIGQALTFPNDPANYVYFTGLQLQIFTWALWFKCTGAGASSSQWVMSEGRDYSTNNAHGTYIRLNQAGTSLAMSSHEVTSNGITIELNKWYHAAMTADGTNMKFYLNGELKQTLAYTMDANYTESAGVCALGKMSHGYTSTTNYFPFNGQINDARIYDSALLETEIKEIAKGLVLHLPLNNNGLGNENLFAYGSDCSSLAGLSNYNGYDLVTEDGYKCAHRTGSLGTTAYLGTKIPLTPSYYRNRSFTLSCDVKIKNIVSGTTNFFIGPYMGGQTIDGTWKGFITHKIYVDGVPQSSLTDQYTTHIHDEKWHRFSYSGTYYDVNYTVNLSPNFYARDYTGDIYIKNLKLEEGLIPTPWSPNPLDEDYPATGSGIPENLFAATDMSEPITYSSSTDWTKHFRMYNGSASIHTIDTTEMTDTIALTTAKSNLGIAFARLNSEINLDPTQYYTISCEAKCTNADLKLCIGLSYYNDQSTWVWRGGNNAKSFTTADTWQKITHTFKPDANTYAICYCFTINPGASPSGTDTFSIRKCKLEKGSTATEWQPSPVDDSYKTLGYYNNITFDQSGYNYNAVKHGTISYSSDAPKYNVSTVFPSSGVNYINLGTQLYNIKDAMTVSLWAKANDWTSTSKGTPFSSVEAGGFGWQVSGANYVFYCGTGTTSIKYANSTITVNNLSAGWHMLSATYDGLVLKTYIDGVLATTLTKYTTKTPIYYNNNSAMFISGESASSLVAPNGGIFRGSISDVRIYATALSEKDILSLYNNNAYIDSDGKIYGEIR